MTAVSVTLTESLPSATSLDNDSMDYTTYDEPPHSNVTTLLNYCKKKLLNPYLRLLTVVGLRPFIFRSNYLSKIVTYAYISSIFGFLLIGYLLQYLACFRRDRGFCFELVGNAELKAVFEQICHAPLLFSFIIPSILHLVGYLYTVILAKNADDDQLLVLVERVFITSSDLSREPLKQRKVVRTLWVFIGFIIMWIVLSLISVGFMMASGSIHFKWFQDLSVGGLWSLKGLLVICTLWQDIVEVTIVSNYCIQVQLLGIYLQFLQEKLLLHPIEPLEWIRHIETFKKMLRYINEDAAPPVCIFMFLTITCASSGLAWLFNLDVIDKETRPIIGISVLNVILWILLALAPFIQAAKLSNECDLLRNAGQEVRARPLIHQDTSRMALDSILLYTATLKLRARLFWVPITGRYLSLFFLVISMSILVLGQCHYLNVFQ